MVRPGLRGRRPRRGRAGGGRRALHRLRDGREVAQSVRDWASAHKGPGKLRSWQESPIGIAALFGLNTVAAFAGTQISIPPLAPLLAFASIQLGGLILGTSGDLTFDAIRRTELTKVFARFSTAWLVGSVGVGLTLAIIAYLLTYLIAKRRHGRDEE